MALRPGGCRGPAVARDLLDGDLADGSDGEGGAEEGGDGEPPAAAVDEDVLGANLDALIDIDIDAEDSNDDEAGPDEEEVALVHDISLAGRGAEESESLSDSEGPPSSSADSDYAAGYISLSSEEDAPSQGAPIGEGNNDDGPDGPGGFVATRLPQDTVTIVDLDGVEVGQFKHTRSNDLYAICCAPGHGRCVKTRTCRSSDKRLAQGRPIGFLTAWLIGSKQFDNRDDHFNWVPPLEHRQVARAHLYSVLHNVDLQHFLGFERHKKMHESSEPEEAT